MERTRRRNDKDIMMCLNTRWKLPINIYRMEICIQEGPIISLIIVVIYDPSHCDETEKKIPYKNKKKGFTVTVLQVLFSFISSLLDTIIIWYLQYVVMGIEIRFFAGN
jgi:hypothetical protein